MLSVFFFCQDYFSILTYEFNLFTIIVLLP